VYVLVHVQVGNGKLTMWPMTMQRTKATAKGSKMYKLCSTAAAGGKLAATCLGWGLPIAPAAPTAPPPTPDPNDPFADIEDAVEDVGER